MTDKVISIGGLTVNFGTFRAVDNLSIYVRRGSITGLIGPNGAGKTTLFNAITGSIKPSKGKVSLDGADVTGLPPERLFVMGLGRTFQIPRPFSRMSVLENVMLAPKSQIGERLNGPFLFSGAMQAQEHSIRQRAMEVLEFMNLAEL